jgi:hypothetical protein
MELLVEFKPNKDAPTDWPLQVMRTLQRGLDEQNMASYKIIILQPNQVIIDFETKNPEGDTQK